MNSTYDEGWAIIHEGSTEKVFYLCLLEFFCKKYEATIKKEELDDGLEIIHVLEIKDRKYIIKTYGEDVNAKVMENLANCGYSSWERNETTAAVFKKCVEDATEAGVFQNFVRDVIEG